MLLVQTDFLWRRVVPVLQTSCLGGHVFTVSSGTFQAMEGHFYFVLEAGSKGFRTGK